MQKIIEKIKSKSWDEIKNDFELHECYCMVLSNYMSFGIFKPDTPLFLKKLYQEEEKENDRLVAENKFISGGLF